VPSDAVSECVPLNAMSSGALVNSRRPVLLIAAIANLCTSCAHAPCQESVAPPPFESSKPVQVVASVDQFRHRAVWIDFDHAFVAYNSIVLTVSKPNRYAWTRLFIQYHGIPTVNGRRIELGDILRFTAPATFEYEFCCGPYLVDIDDIEFLESKLLEGDG
jgi:hypothetical protein